ncbi:MAG: flavoprotein [Verrucomicrobia bacterium CG_4_10_14_3_um_filter_43_23]|nr:MAG: hypothetical protein AUJ82_03330 [Verrucomicrobia bacterium CG1_02_43_26]PIP59728.1 MAG: flavoprotein [Verrucomicrobia bacterium CG22_combo_CG10-13_8_21_14_all_43_17]PIX57740.1 MAG: flavoprotein [Verrucomicrobia bacterium CG_4_10_14_3_um_filter_43_23]PIY62532.1 MAG: flavoprotein [Verrucomicrobia bacterium CG_4_10_14_0_8_um_filter_43_34]PJA44648.1 MAG: flavoprotein [Verrucomicrobia bacterium CG_4_9_14_3_um_filter_43_20]
MSILIISCSLNPESKSRLLAEFAFNALQDLSVETQFINLQNYDLPICDGADAYNHPALTELSEAIAAADGIILATPIYNYNVAAATKNLLELTNDAWNHKVVGFLCSAGGHHSYMAVMPFANSLMLDFRCVIMPNFVYAHPTDFDEQDQPNPNICARIYKLIDNTIKFSNVSFSH